MRSLHISFAQSSKEEVVTLSDSAAVTEPLLDVRDVLEAFRRNHVVQTGWAETLSRAAQALDNLPTTAEVQGTATWIASELRKLVFHGLAYDEQVLSQVANRTADILNSMRVPGIPRPEDEHWEFS